MSIYFVLSALYFLNSTFYSLISSLYSLLLSNLICFDFHSILVPSAQKTSDMGIIFLVTGFLANGGFPGRISSFKSGLSTYVAL